MGIFVDCVARKNIQGPKPNKRTVGIGHFKCVEVQYYTDKQENMWARLRDSRPGASLIHAT